MDIFGVFVELVLGFEALEKLDIGLSLFLGF